TSTKVFPEWSEGGKVFYKVRLKALNPQNFKDGSDLGTLAVRYVLQPQDDKHTILHIDARFVEDYRRVSHPSNGSVESAEYKTIRDKLDEIEAIKDKTEELKKEKESNRSAATDDTDAKYSSSPTRSSISADSSRIESVAANEEPVAPPIPSQTLEE